jgi:hypothetical protein
MLADHRGSHIPRQVRGSDQVADTLMLKRHHR